MVLVESTRVTADSMGELLPPPYFYDPETGKIVMESVSPCDGYFFVRQEYQSTLRYALEGEVVREDPEYDSATQRTWSVSQIGKDGSDAGSAQHFEMCYGLPAKKLLLKFDDQKDTLHIEKYRVGGRDVTVLNVETRWNNRLSGVRKYTGDILTDDGVIYSEWKINGKPSPETIVRLVDFYRGCGR